MPARRLVPFGLLLLLLLTLAGCAGGGGGGVQRKPAAWVHVALEADGDAQLDLVATVRLNPAAVRALARRIAVRTFPGGQVVRVHTDSSRGEPFARVDIDHAYRTGRAPSLRIDTAHAWRELDAAGYSESALRLWLPSVPATVGTSPGAQPLGLQRWRLRDDPRPPVVDVAMRPQPMRFYRATLLPVVAATGVALAFLVRRRFLAVPAAVLAVGTAVAAVKTSAGRQGDNLGVAGLLDGKALDVATVVPLAALPVALPAAMLLATIAVRSYRNAPDRYPERKPESGLFW